VSKHEDLHFAVCEAVSIINMSHDMARSADGRKISTILRQALIDFADAALSSAQQEGTAMGECFSIAHDGFVGEVIGHYTTREGKRGVVLQQVGTRVVHVYGEKWIAPSEQEEPSRG
jgi:hypothetical protein